MTRLLLTLAAVVAVSIGLCVVAYYSPLGAIVTGGVGALLFRRRAPDRSAQDAIAADAREERIAAVKRADDQLAADKAKGAKGWFDQFGRGP